VTFLAFQGVEISDTGVEHRYIIPVRHFETPTNQKLGERKRTAGKSSTEMTSSTIPWQGYGILVTTDQDEFTATGSSSLTAKFPDSDDQDLATYQNPFYNPKDERPKRGRLISPLLPYTTDATLRHPTPPITFPLSPDHCLITLIQYNVVRAMLFNMSILSLLYCVPMKCSLSFGVLIHDTIPPENIPPDLKPTLLQQSTPHPFYISAIPFPAMRDNLIRFHGTYDSLDLCYDLGQALYEGFDDLERRGFLVWGDPWRVNGWEVTEGFVKKWGVFLHGSLELIESTNNWRELRGEDRLNVGL